jgi:hypothetical protein
MAVGPGKFDYALGIALGVIDAEQGARSSCSAKGAWTSLVTPTRRTRTGSPGCCAEWPIKSRRISKED